MKIVNSVAYVLLIIGGLNWGLFGLFNIDLVAILLGSIQALQTLVYILVGVSAVIVGISHFKKCDCCEEDSVKPNQNTPQESVM